MQNIGRPLAPELRKVLSDQLPRLCSDPDSLLYPLLQAMRAEVDEDTLKAVTLDTLNAMREGFIWRKSARYMLILNAYNGAFLTTAGFPEEVAEHNAEVDKVLKSHLGIPLTLYVRYYQGFMTLERAQELAAGNPLPR